ncbi:MAG: gamma-glutamyltransferase family protein [Terriglobia bacterium]
MKRSSITVGISVAILTTLAFAREASSATMKPLVAGKRGAVAAGHPLVAEAGLRILEKGGNAVDAGVATVFAASVVEMDGFAIGGECPILIKLRDKPAVAVNGAGIAPQMATVEFFKKLSRDDPRIAEVASITKGTIPAYGLLSPLVPGAIDTLLVALQTQGTMSLAEVIQPAIELAEGVPLDGRFARGLARNESIIAKWPTSKRVFLPGGHAPKEQTIFAQPELARTFRRMAEVDRRNAGRGRAAAIDAVRDFVYRGPIAKEISDFCRQAGCLLREGDFAAYRAKVEQPLETDYRGIEVFKVSFWSQSPVFLENLNLLEGFDLKAMGHNSADYIHTVVEAMKLGYADRDAYYGDPDFGRIPIQLISKDYANLRRPLIDMRKASAEHIPGDPERMQARATDEFIRMRYKDRNAEHQDTTCVNVIDSAGNLFSATPSGAWYPAVVAGDTGIPLGQRMQSFVLTAGHPNQLAPHKRPRITLTPTLALKEKKPWLVFSTPCGDSQDQTLLQVFLNIEEFAMNPQEAVEAPRFDSGAMYSSFDDHGDEPLVLQLEKRIPDSVAEQLRQRGHKVVWQNEWGNHCAPTAIEYDAANGVIKAGADVRGHRYALAW